MIKTFTILKLLILLIVISIIMIIGCDPATKYGDPIYTMTGTVTDSVTGQPIDSAQVYHLYLDSTYYSVYTDSLGQFRYGGSSEMPSPLTCAKEGYVTKELVIDRVNNVYRYDNVDFQLAPVP